MPNIAPPHAAQPIIEDEGKMQQVFRTWTQAITKLDPIIGLGSPEGVVSSEQYRLYIDSTIPAVPGAIEYRKMQAAIGGDSTMGWVATG